MKYSLSDIIKDLLAKIPVLENRINTLSTKITVLSQSSNPNKVDFYWIDTTINYHRALQLAVKHNGVEYILHDFSDYVEREGYITFQVDSYPAQGSDNGHVSFHIYNISNPYPQNTVALTFNEIPNDDAVRAYLKNTIMPQLGLEHVYLKGHGISTGTEFNETVSIDIVKIVVQGPGTASGVEGYHGGVLIGDQSFEFNDKWRSKAYLEAYLRNTYMPEHNMTRVRYSGIVLPVSDDWGAAEVSGIVER